MEQLGFCVKSLDDWQNCSNFCRILFKCTTSCIYGLLLIDFNLKIGNCCPDYWIQCSVGACTQDKLDNKRRQCISNRIFLHPQIRCRNPEAGSAFQRVGLHFTRDSSAFQRLVLHFTGQSYLPHDSSELKRISQNYAFHSMSSIPESYELLWVVFISKAFFILHYTRYSKLNNIFLHSIGYSSAVHRTT